MVWADALAMVLTCGLGQLVGVWCLSLVAPQLEFWAKIQRVGVYLSPSPPVAVAATAVRSGQWFCCWWLIEYDISPVMCV